MSTWALTGIAFALGAALGFLVALWSNRQKHESPIAVIPLGPYQTISVASTTPIDDEGETNG